MSTLLKNLSKYDAAKVPSGEHRDFAIVVSEWNPEVTNSLLKGAVETLIKHGVDESDIIVKYVPGTFELTMGAKMLIESYSADAVIAIGCVIQGETRHFDFICQGVSQGLTQLNIEYDVPVIFGVLTTENQQQALDRAGGKHGNKGVECAIAALKMAELAEEFYGDDFLDDMFDEDYDDDDFDDDDDPVEDKPGPRLYVK
ncbi:MAG: 6,7-dimethyl-8-ribityllumazine synthase [Bacteroidales bacterium]|nr:6,7-dimethyl-8-ribityllumazine synthase [Bacteroidales bacterium]MCF8457459.1 6,7-dimethyl-8-ribityllumazine synthase [Bacteroidales bacterium]